ncbi:MAG: M20/M25/M40 family metallo-hydrolase [Firmicutes bacterium]|nr:M20/M25/M40 family metallo-hydrolase [Bacillota bacterium]
MADSITAAYGGSCEIEFFDGFPPLVNDQNITDTMVSLAKEAFGTENVLFRDRASMGADDFAYFCQEVPATYWIVGAAVEKEEERKSLHNEYLILEEEAMRNGLYLELAGVFELLK